MIFFIKNVLNSPSAMISMTGLTKSEFDFILPAFEKAEDEYAREKDNDKERKRARGGGRKPNLKTAEERLFFILFYFKTSPLQQVSAALFGMSVSQTNFWIHRLSVIMKKSLGEDCYLPEKNPSAYEEILKKCAGLSFVIDGTERRIQRPKDPEKQKIFYSGKKKGTYSEK